MKHLLPALLLLGLAATASHAQTKAGANRPHPRPAAPAPADTLTERVARLDADMFGAFNAHDVPRLMGYFAPDLEFYHDKGGLADYAHTTQGFTQMSKQSPDIHRELVPGSLRVYPIPGYGAMEIGAHRFCHQENGRADCGTFQFTMLWRQQGSKWQVTRVVSYGH